MELEKDPHRKLAMEPSVDDVEAVAAVAAVMVPADPLVNPARPRAEQFPNITRKVLRNRKSVSRNLPTRRHPLPKSSRDLQAKGGTHKIGPAVGDVAEGVAAAAAENVAQINVVQINENEGRHRVNRLQLQPPAMMISKAT